MSHPLKAKLNHLIFIWDLAQVIFSNFSYGTCIIKDTLLNSIKLEYEELMK